jgi:hypothetical protein
MTGAKGFASSTSVSVDKTRLEIEALLAKAGATARGTAIDEAKNLAKVIFYLKGARFCVSLPLPPYKATLHYKNTRRALATHEQAVRTRWRVLLLLLKSKLEAVRLGISSAEKEFLADLVLENGRTVHEDLPELLRLGMGARQLTQGDPR